MSYSNKYCQGPCGWDKKEYNCFFYASQYAEREYKGEDKYEDDCEEQDWGFKEDKCEEKRPEKEKFLCKCHCCKVEEKPKCPCFCKEEKKPECPCFCKEEKKPECPCFCKEEKKPECPCFCKEEKKPECPCKKDDFEDKCEEKKEQRDDCKWIRFFDKPCECSRGGWFGVSYKPDDRKVW